MFSTSRDQLDFNVKVGIRYSLVSVNVDTTTNCDPSGSWIHEVADDLGLIRTHFRAGDNEVR
ncbi:MAG: hypothetical protein ABIP02_00865 [Arenimonas sp.]